MNEPLYRHVLFKDLQSYLKRDDYFSSYTDIEKSWIKKNLDLNSEGVSETSVSRLKELMETNSLQPGSIYIIPYLEKYSLIVMSVSSNQIAGQCILLSDDSDSIFWDIKYDISKDRIIYMKDNNNNVANYDFKYVNKIFDNNESKNNYINATNIKLSGICCNNIISGNNIEIKVPISNLVGELNDIIIDEDELGILNSNIQKVIIFIDNKYYIDYLDLETLTHQFYEIKNSLYITQ